jgi:hypothetical protein
MCLHGADAWNFLCGEDAGDGRCLTPLVTEVPDPSGDEGACPQGIWEKKLTFPMYKNILLHIKDIREK